MRIALFIIIIFLQMILHGLKIIPNSLIGFMSGVAYICLINDYFKNKKSN